MQVLPGGNISKPMKETGFSPSSGHTVRLSPTLLQHSGWTKRGFWWKTVVLTQVGLQSQPCPPPPFPSLKISIITYVNAHTIWHCLYGCQCCHKTKLCIQNAIQRHLLTVFLFCRYIHCLCFLHFILCCMCVCHVLLKYLLTYLLIGTTHDRSMSRPLACHCRCLSIETPLSPKNGKGRCWYPVSKAI